ncbi:ABC transporter ATP-binding protein [Pararhizobium mangrovi]|uniref:ABC transporter ATP-binding protein n=1 Tax=Pararhizobium mangrovi TaxID=2590452 RepID=A0A506UEH0_9HYPH|nr:ABC transporter ATP-binding protein [Pararhizobium mangrovi]TPW31265.1 ABC transporter ATP-binding protein [Pararhizobium mangrovi]
MSKPLLAVEHLDLSIGDRPVLRDVGLTLEAGEVLGIVGESGSGKSMTANAIMQLLPETAQWTGSIRLDGKALEGYDEARMCTVRGREIGMVFQEPMTALNPVRTIGDQVAETVRIHTDASRREARDIARETLNRVGLPEERFSLDRYPHDLSGGQRQRVVIAMAIVLKPKLLIADEPTTALDVTTQANILALLKRLVAEDGAGLVLITHDLAVMAGMADRIVVMRNGAIVEDGRTQTLFTTPHHPHTKALLEASTSAPAGKRQLETSAEILTVSGVVRDYALPRRSLFSPAASFCAVDHVSMALRRGENVGLVGESGCGKSTLVRTILGLDPLTTGSIEIGGLPFHAAGSKPDQALRRKVQVVFQDPYASFDPRHRVARLIGEPFHLLADAPRGKQRRERIAAALADVGLQPDDAERYIHEFSGGERQRIAIARALIIEPEIIVLDEAVSALDVSIRSRILDLLADLSRRRSIAYLFVSHDLSVVRAITDRIYVMQAGRIIEEGETERVFAEPRHAYTRSLIAATPDIERELAKSRRKAERAATP